MSKKEEIDLFCAENFRQICKNRSKTKALKSVQNCVTRGRFSGKIGAFFAIFVLFDSQFFNISSQKINDSRRIFSGFR